MSAIDALNAARAAWQRSQPQTFLEVDDLTRLPAAETTAAPECPPLYPLGELAAGSTTLNTTGVGRTSPEEMSAADARQDRF